ncbi:Outer membrane protein [Methylacidimicrobium sp. AP8]|uniref:outer membrane protein assembly factor BamA n=1 Tax=Methylacidimicrobium sp. AP8 TaxID=2730359 RepID=UPI0018C0F75D|nr:outer membrane protein assembly factor BamA [Methylacidimicrobium sp. AP8]CAB4243442.1 Outer membrane protein [Methylacidimicrobium sp. AP8]
MKRSTGFPLRWLRGRASALTPFILGLAFWLWEYEAHPAGSATEGEETSASSSQGSAGTGAQAISPLDSAPKTPPALLDQPPVPAATASEAQAAGPAPAESPAPEPVVPTAPRLAPPPLPSEAPSPPAAQPAAPAEEQPSPAPAAPKKHRPKKVVAPPSASGAQAPGPPVKEIEVVYVGPKSVNRSMILSNMHTTVGQPYVPATVEEDVRNLYATGLFTNLRITTEPMEDGVKVLVVVQPKPLIKEIVIKGSGGIKTETIRRQMKAKVGDPLSEFQISADAEKIKEYYQNHGYGDAQVNYKIDVNEEFGRAVVTMLITEGEKRFITSLNFVGNNSFPAKELRKSFKTKKKDLLSFFNKSGLLKEEQFQEDLRKLKEFYQNHGYIDMSIRDIKIEHPTKEQTTITIVIHEGVQYHVGTIQLSGNQIYSNGEILSLLKMTEGSVFSPKGLDDDIKELRDYYGQRGYIDAEIRPERLPNVESGKIDLLFKITEGSQAYVDKIVIQGNTVTKDKVIRRELAVQPGDVYNSVEVDASRKRLENLGYFEKVEINPQDTNVPNRKNMVITLQEKHTGNLSFGLGYSTIESLMGFVELNQGNFDIANPPSFTGAGQKFRVRAQLGIFMETLLMSFTEPWFMDKPIAVGGDLFFNQYTYMQFYQGFNMTNMGFDLRAAKRLSQWVTLSTRYDLTDYTLWGMLPQIEQVPVYAQNHGSRSQSDVSVDLIYDSRDSVTITRHGTMVDLNLLGAGGPLLGQTDIYKAQINISHYESLPFDIIFWSHLNAGMVQAYGTSSFVPLFDSYFLGGPRSLRGFDYALVGPNYLPYDFPIGGQTMAFTNLEFTVPVVDRVRVAAFTDIGFNAGSLIGPIQTPNIPGLIAGEGINIVADAGIGLRLYLPIGPLRLDYGIPYIYTSWLNQTGRFYFDVGYSF